MKKDFEEITKINEENIEPLYKKMFEQYELNEVNTLLNIIYRQFFENFQFYFYRIIEKNIYFIIEKFLNQNKI